MMFVGNTNAQHALWEQTSPKPSPSSLAANLRQWLASPEARSPRGAYVAWVDEAGQQAFEYPEITGYALTYVASLMDPTDEELAIGDAAAAWLTARLAAGMTEARPDYDGGLTYNFDLGMVAAGLINWGDFRAAPTTLEYGLSICRGLIGQIEECGHLESFPPRSAPTTRSSWSTSGYAHVTKTVQCLLLADLHGEPGARDAAAGVVYKGLTQQQADGRWVTHLADRETMLHPHLYAVEGLWMFACATRDERALAAGRQAAEWAWSQQEQTGGFPRYVDRAGNRGPEQADLTAQALRAACLFGLADWRVESTLGWLEWAAAPGRTGRAMRYQPSTGERHLNVWSTLFAYQALQLVAKRPLSWRYVV